MSKPAHPGFEAAIRASPGDSSVHGVYADWLEEQGDVDAATAHRLTLCHMLMLQYPAEDCWRRDYAYYLEPTDPDRAEFIRLQLALAAPCNVSHKHEPLIGTARRAARRIAMAGFNRGVPLAPAGECPKCDWLWDQDRAKVRAAELLAAHQVTWLAPLFKELPGYPFAPGRMPANEVRMNQLARGGVFHGRMLMRSTFRRGFLAGVKLMTEEVLEFGPTLCRLAPLESIEVLDRQPYRTSENGVRSWFWYRGRNAPVPGVDRWFAHLLALREEPGLGPVNLFSVNTVPSALWPADDVFPEQEDPDNPGAGFYREFPTAAAAVGWLSERALVWCRNEAMRLAAPEVPA